MLYDENKITLLCNGRRRFLGCDSKGIRLSVQTDDFNISEYRAVFSSSYDRLQNGIYDLWDTKVQDCGRFFYYGGKPLQERQRVYWRILFGENDCSDIAWFETGITAFKGQWICSSQDNAGGTLLFRNEFSAESYKDARLYVCGLGFFQAYLNGQPLDDTYYKPLFTDYTDRDVRIGGKRYISTGHRITYYTYDLGAVLRGHNVLEIEVADGWFCDEDKIIERPLSFGKPKLCFDLYAGGELLLSSGPNSLVCLTNRKSTMFLGDRIDFTQGYGEFFPAVRSDAPTGTLTAPQTFDDACAKELFPSVLLDEPCSRIYDFHENHSGSLAFCVNGERGTVLRCEFFEVFREDGSPNLLTCGFVEKKTAQTILQVNVYTLSGAWDEVQPLFGWRGYRYVRVTCERPFRIRQMRSRYIHTQLREDAEFTCSEPLFNDLFAKFKRTYLNNAHAGVPSDCPHREKLPYTGDGQLCAESAMYCFGAETFYAKWLEDILDAQTPDGFIPHTAPNMGGGGGYNWGNALFIVAQLLYRFTGDVAYLQKIEKPLRKWIACYENALDANGIVSKNGHTWFLGDWLMPETVKFDVRFMSTMCYYNAVRALAEIAGKGPEAPILAEKLEKVRSGILYNFYREDTGDFCQGVQGENILPLHYGIAAGERAQRAEANAADYYSRTRGYHLDTGIVATPVLIEYFTDHGRRELAYMLMTARGEPSYAAMLQDETTLCECWNKQWPRSCIEAKLVDEGTECSHDHPMFGSTVAWLFKRVAGLDLSELYKKTVWFRPKFTDFLSSASASKRTAYGVCSIAWNSRPSLQFRVRVPNGLTAKFELEDMQDSVRVVQTGETIRPEEGKIAFDLSAGEWEICAETS